MNILIVDDHEIVRRGLRDLLLEEYPADYVAEAGDGAELAVRLAERSWDLVLLDIVIPGMSVLKAIAQVRQSSPGARVLMLTAVPEAEYAVSTIKAGANGFITKQYAASELKKAVREVLAGEVYLSSGASAALAANLKGESSGAPHELLSDRELEVFRMIAEGKAIKQIAFDLSVSAKTVATYVARIKTKTGLENYVDIARYALQNKLVN